MNKSPKGKKCFYLSMITPDTHSHLAIYSSLIFSVNIRIFSLSTCIFFPKPKREVESVFLLKHQVPEVKRTRAKFPVVTSFLFSLPSFTFTS